MGRKERWEDSPTNGEPGGDRASASISGGVAWKKTLSDVTLGRSPGGESQGADLNAGRLSI